MSGTRTDRGAARDTEAAVGGLLSIVETGDWIILDVAQRQLTLDVPESDLVLRRPSRATTDGFATPTRGWSTFTSPTSWAPIQVRTSTSSSSSGYAVTRESH